MLIKCLVLGGGGILGFGGGGGSADFIFMGARIFLIDIKQGKKRQKDKWFYFHAATMFR